MGTHPIFESDFDCLTDLSVIFERPAKWEASAGATRLHSRFLEERVKKLEKRKENRKNSDERISIRRKTLKYSKMNCQNKRFTPPKPMTPVESEEIQEKKELTTIEKEMKIVKREKKKHRRKMVKSREMTIEDLQAGIEDDDAIIRNMERKLGIKKKKKKELTTSEEIKDSLKMFDGEAIDLESGKPEDLDKIDENAESLEEGFEEGEFSEDEEMFDEDVDEDLLGEEDDFGLEDDEAELETKEAEEIEENAGEAFTAEELAAFDQHHQIDSDEEEGS